MYDAFISYSDADSAWAETLYRRLRRFRMGDRAVSLFYAPHTITAGQSIPRFLSEGLNDSRCMLAVVTPEWLASEWTRLEHEISLWSDPGAVAQRLIPLLVKEVTLPPALARLKYVDFRDPDTFQAGLRQTVDALRSGAVRQLRVAADLHERESVLNAALLPWLGPSGPSFDFLWPEMFVDPPVVLRRHPGPEARLSAWLAAERAGARRTYAILGEPGSGKSTALRSMLLNGGSRLPAQRTLVHARDLGEREEVLKRRSREAGGDGFAVLVDGLDEAGSALFADIAGVLTRLSRTATTIVVASREDFFERNFSQPGTDDLELHEVVEMKAWSVSDVVSFAARYAERMGDPQVARALGEVLDAIPGADRMMRNPMRLTLLLYLLAVGAAVDATALREPFILYRLFYEEWLKKEKQRRTTSLGFSAIRSAHVRLARWLYENRGSHGASPADLQEPDGASPRTGEELIRDSAFADLLTFREDFDGRPRVLSFRHETIGEFLLAQDILESFRNGGTTIDKGLRLTVADDVNRFVRSGMNDLAVPAADRLLRNLTARYRELLEPHAEADTSERSVRIREQILYYVGRLPLNECPEILRQAYRDETNALNRRSAALGAIVQGDSTIESAYLARLEQPDEALLNRSVQLVYFGDVQADLHAYVDGGGDWSRVRAAIYRRLEMFTPREDRLRWWDLRTLRSFYRSRGYRDVVSEGEAEILRALARQLPQDTARSRAIGLELDELLGELGMTARG
ncbi:toll/interleukin-1 receptor domain-containing protein [Streptomyces sp. 184]|uniref:TIR domain-containing protein n=1 Tax=Streptomyces sp. 184 TaxID=1827526 RepID=UPI003891F32A